MPHEDKEHRNEVQRIYRAKRQQWVSDFKNIKRCKKCGEDQPHKLAFHHRDPSAKTSNINPLMWSPIERLLEEINKCDVLCHNCHADVHHEIRQAGR